MAPLENHINVNKKWGTEEFFSGVATWTLELGALGHTNSDSLNHLQYL